MSNEFMSLSGRKHLTLEDGKIVQYWRDQGLTLQKIAEKLKVGFFKFSKRFQFEIHCTIYVDFFCDCDLDANVVMLSCNEAISSFAKSKSYYG